MESKNIKPIFIISARYSGTSIIYKMSIREILNEENAILVEPDNPGKLAQNIKEVLQNHQLSEKISARAFQDVQQHTWQKRVNKILQHINL